MIFKYLRQHRSWLLLFFFMQFLILFVAYIDAAIPLMPLLYIVGLNLVVGTVFLLLRYSKDSRFYRSLENWDPTYDLSVLQEPASPYEEIVFSALTMQTDLYRQETAASRLLLEQEKDDLLSWIHEVKTPLTAMQLMLERLPGSTLQSQLMYEWLRIHHLLDQQLHHRRIPFIHNDLFIESVELGPVISREIKELKSWCIQKGIGFEVILEAEEVITDAKWLGFILRQFLTNAVKYSEASEILIKSSQGKGEQVILTIQDHGRGIDPKDLPRIFDKGFTSTASHQNGASTGMGLYLAAQSADPLLIRIQVESILGEGTLFTLTFPVRNDFLHITGM